MTVACRVCGESGKGCRQVLAMRSQMRRRMEIVRRAECRRFKLKQCPCFHFALRAEDGRILGGICRREYRSRQIRCRLRQRFATAAAVLVKMHAATPVILIRRNERGALYPPGYRIAPRDRVREAKVRRGVPIWDASQFLFENLQCAKRRPG